MFSVDPLKAVHLALCSHPPAAKTMLAFSLITSAKQCSSEWREESQNRMASRPVSIIWQVSLFFVTSNEAILKIEFKSDF